MTGQDFLRLLDEAFAPFLRELGFAPCAPSISGRSYHARFDAETHAVSVSFEPGDYALFVVVLERDGDHFSTMDDRARSPRLADLNARYMKHVSDEERRRNESAFARVATRDEHEQALLRAAKDLQLVLPRYLAEQRRR